MAGVELSDRAAAPSPAVDEKHADPERVSPPGTARPNADVTVSPAERPSGLPLLRRVGSNFVLRASGAAMGFAFNVLLARSLGADGAGIYFLAFAAFTVCSVVGRVGLDNALVRFGAVGHDRRDGGWVEAIFRNGMGIALVGSVATTVALYAASPWLADVLFGKPELREPLQVMALAVLPFSALNLYACLLRAVNWVSVATLFQTFLVPTINLCLLFVIARVATVHDVAAIYVIATAFACLGAAALWRIAWPAGPLTAGISRSELFRTSLPLLLVASVYLVNRWADIIVLGAFRPAAEVGVYGVVSRVAQLVLLVVLAFDAIVTPSIARYWARRDVEAIGRLATWSSRWMAIVAAPLFVLGFFFPRTLFSLFGEEFTGGHIALCWLLGGQLYNLCTGLVGQILVMTGHQGALRNITLLAGGVNIALNLALAPVFGASGAAAATCTALVLSNTLTARAVRRLLGVDAHVFGSFRK